MLSSIWWARPARNPVCGARSSKHAHRCMCLRVLQTSFHQPPSRMRSSIGWARPARGYAARLRGQAVKTRTLIHGIARVANSVPSTVFRNEVEHWVGAAGTRKYIGGTWTLSSIATGQRSTHKGSHSAARSRIAVVRIKVFGVL